MAINFLDKLRSKSDGTKRVIALFASLALTFVIAIVWLSSLYIQAQLADPENAKYEEQSPFKTIVDGAKANLRWLEKGSTTTNTGPAIIEGDGFTNDAVVPQLPENGTSTP